jgi:hypothetical protein
MWLLNTTTLTLHSFFENIPDYVILSHTWGDGEVAFEDIAQPHARKLAGYEKIIGCCRLAVNDGFEWAWIDTCCIDKRSSAELSEAINSMYKWYWDAAICYAYLSDVSIGSGRGGELKSSRWFTRGWTLQELLAPDVVEFYDAQWKYMGAKSELNNVIVEATRIDPKFILNRETIEEASVGTKFSWTAARKTTRAEDMAYCMLGIMQVNMPMLYGEGERAFHRLQLEIIRQTNDHSVFAWEPVHTGYQTTTILAPSLTCFEKSAGFRPVARKRSLDASTYETTNNGLRATLAVIRIDHGRLIALLDCEAESGNTIGVWLEATANGKYQRLPGSKLARVSADETEEAEFLSMYLVVRNEHGDKESNRLYEMVIGDLLANRELYVNGITVSTRNTTITVQDAVPLILRYDEAILKKETLARIKIGKDQIRYLLRKLVLQEGEVACIRLIRGLFHQNQGCVTILIGLRNGRPLIRGAFSTISSDTLWSDEIQTCTIGDSNLAGNYLSILSESGNTAAQVRTKKRRVNGKLQWRVLIEVRRCLSCDNSWSDSSPACKCPPLYSQDPDRTETAPIHSP